mgnify:CR=1 FL=1
MLTIIIPVRNESDSLETIMDHYSKYGHKDFYIAIGYRGHIIKKYFKKI